MNISSSKNFEPNTLRGKISFMVNRFLGDLAYRAIKRDLKKGGFNFNPTLEEKRRSIYTDGC